MSKRFEGKVVIVTGASSGIGWETARRFAREGARVVVAARRQDRLEALVEEIRTEGGLASAKATDVSDVSQVEDLIAHTVSEFGQLDILVNNAGFGIQGRIEDATIEQARRLFDVNLLSVVAATRAALPHLRRTQGSIVNVASVGGLVPMPLHALYSASKHALVGLGEALAFETRADGVRIQTVCPGPVRTEFSNALEGNRLPDEWFERFSLAYDTPETIANGILRAALKKRSGTRLPSLRSALPRWSYVLLGPVSRLAMGAATRRMQAQLTGSRAG